MAPNPFKYASPLGEGDLFVDRQEEMEKILELISRAQPVAIYGERRIGKTSLLNRIGARLSDQRVAYISLEALRDEDEFLKWLAGVLGCKDWSMPIDLVPALEAQKPILLLDEFDKAALSDQFTSDFFHLLRAWASQGLIRLVIASARKPSELFSQSENASLTQTFEFALLEAPPGGSLNLVVRLTDEQGRSVTSDAAQAAVRVLGIPRLQSALAWIFGSSGLLTTLTGLFWEHFKKALAR